MSKWLKIFGVSAAVGTAVYAFIKYKSDEKFKEKVDEVGEKIEEKADQVMTKASKFVNKHPGTTTVVLVGSSLLIAVIGAIRADRKRQELMERAYQDFHEQYLEPDPADIVQEEARRAAEKQAMYDDIMENPHDYYIIKKDDYNELVNAYNSMVESNDS